LIKNLETNYFEPNDIGMRVANEAALDGHVTLGRYFHVARLAKMKIKMLESSGRLTATKSLASSDDLGERFGPAGLRQLALPINILAAVPPSCHPAVS
jgi:hypothetical protein